MGTSGSSRGRGAAESSAGRTAKLPVAAFTDDGWALYKFLFDAARDIILFVEPDGRIVEANRAAIEVYGYTSQELLSLNILDLRATDLPPDVVSQLAQADEEDTLFETMHRRKNGTVFPVEVSSRGAILSGRRLNLSIIRDISPRKRAEQAFAAQEREHAEAAAGRAAEMRSVLDTMIDCVFVADRDGKVVIANEAGTRLLGLNSADELLGHEMGHFSQVRARDPQGHPVAPSDLPLARALSGETVESLDLIIYNAGSERDVRTRTNASPIRNPEGEIVGAVALMRDVTELTALDSMKDQFITVAAHELKTPVAVMKGYAQLLLRHSSALGDQQQRYLHAIERGADRMNEVVNDLLEVSRFQLGGMRIHKEDVFLDEVVRQVVAQFASSAQGHRLVSSICGPVPVTADSSRLEQVLLSLLDNAVRYSPTGSAIRIELVTAEGYAVVTVRDEGVGIPKEKQARIFDPFYRAHTGTPWDFGGMGVALYLCKETVSMHGGKIWFESDEGKGSVFHFSLPLRGG